MARIALAGGGTAGHVNPLLATAVLLRDRGHTVLAVGTAEGLEVELTARVDIDLALIDRVPFPRRLDRTALAFPGQFRRAVRQARDLMGERGIDAVVGFGGYVSTPMYVAANREGIPVVVHEANARPGLANRWGARSARAVAVTFPGTPLPRATVTGLPLRAEIEALADSLADPQRRIDVRQMARRALGFDSEAPVLLVTGGSLGAAHLNDAVSAAAASLIDHGVWIYHLTGANKSEKANRARSKLPTALRSHYRVEEYTHDMAVAFAAADAVVCRGGAMTVSEVTALGLPALYVPLPHGNGEQALNAAWAVEAGAARMVANDEVTATVIELVAEDLLLGPEVASTMSRAAHAIARRDASAQLADLVESVL